jgi:hypothetical protein
MNHKLLAPSHSQSLPSEDVEVDPSSSIQLGDTKAFLQFIQESNQGLGDRISDVVGFLKRVLNQARKQLGTSENPALKEVGKPKVSKVFSDHLQEVAAPLQSAEGADPLFNTTYNQMRLLEFALRSMQATIKILGGKQGVSDRHVRALVDANLKSLFYSDLSPVKGAEPDSQRALFQFSTIDLHDEFKSHPLGDPLETIDPGRFYLEFVQLSQQTATAVISLVQEIGKFCRAKGEDSLVSKQDIKGVTRRFAAETERLISEHLSGAPSPENYQAYLRELLEYVAVLIKEVGNRREVISDAVAKVDFYVDDASPEAGQVSERVVADGGRPSGVENADAQEDAFSKFLGIFSISTPVKTRSKALREGLVPQLDFGDGPPEAPPAPPPPPGGLLPPPPPDMLTAQVRVQRVLKPDTATVNSLVDVLVRNLLESYMLRFPILESQGKDLRILKESDSHDQLQLLAASQRVRNFFTYRLSGNGLLVPKPGPTEGGDVTGGEGSLRVDKLTADWTRIQGNIRQMLDSYTSAQDKANLLQAIGQVLFVFDSQGDDEVRLQLGNPMTLFTSDPKLLAYYLRGISQTEFDGVALHRDKVLQFLSSDALAVIGGTGRTKLCEDEHFKPILNFLNLMAAQPENHEAIESLRDVLMRHEGFQNAYGVSKALHLKALWEGAAPAPELETVRDDAAELGPQNDVVNVFSVLQRVLPHLSALKPEDFDMDSRMLTGIALGLARARCDKLILQVEYLLPRSNSNDKRDPLVVPGDSLGSRLESHQILDAVLGDDGLRAELKDALHRHIVSKEVSPQSAAEAEGGQRKDVEPKSVKVLAHLLEITAPIAGDHDGVSAEQLRLRQEEHSQLLDLAHAACIKDSTVLPSLLKFFPVAQQRALIFNSFKMDSEGLLIAVNSLGEDWVNQLIADDGVECNDALEKMDARGFKTQVLALIFSYLQGQELFSGANEIKSNLQNLMKVFLKDDAVRLKIEKLIRENYVVFYNLVVKLELFHDPKMKLLAEQLKLKPALEKWLREVKQDKGASVDPEQVTTLTTLKMVQLKYLA